jgi:hypothetical protein
MICKSVLLELLLWVNLRTTSDTGASTERSNRNRLEATEGNFCGPLLLGVYVAYLMRNKLPIHVPIHLT